MQNEGRLVPEPNWARIEGATELSDLVHWMYDVKQQKGSTIDMALDLDFQDPEWLQAAAYVCTHICSYIYIYVKVKI